MFDDLGREHDIEGTSLQLKHISGTKADFLGVKLEPHIIGEFESKVVPSDIVTPLGESHGEVSLRGRDIENRSAARGAFVDEREGYCDALPVGSHIAWIGTAPCLC